MRITLTLILFVLLSNITVAQNTTDSINSTPEKVIKNLFLALKTGDSTLARSVFSEEAQLITSYVNADGTQKIHKANIDHFIEAIGAPHDAIWDERISNLSIDQSDGLAQAWMMYEFYSGEFFSHCGVNAIQIMLQGNDWKIISIADTRRKQDECEILQKIELH